MPKPLKSSAKTKASDDLFGAAGKGRAPLKVASRSTSAEAGYTARDIEVLEGLEPVRRRPGMYIGGTDEKALHHLFAEGIDNAMDEGVAGHDDRMGFERGNPKGKLEKVGRVPNRRGTKVRFKPDAQIFGAKAHFRPERVFRMTRSKAYLFGGVEIRWHCAPELLKGIENVPESATFHFEDGLRDYLAVSLEGTTLVHPDIFTGSAGKAGRAGAVPWAGAWTADAGGFLNS